MENDAIRITYNCDKGHLVINLWEFLPASQSRLNKLFKIVDLSDSAADVEYVAKVMAEFCKERISQCECNKESYKKHIDELETAKYPAREKMEYMIKKFERAELWRKEAKEEYKFYKKASNDAKREYKSILNSQKSNVVGYRKAVKQIEQHKKNIEQISEKYQVEVEV